jgi:hypothetical protein
MLDVLLALKRGGNRFVSFEIDERLDVVPLGEALGQTFSMLVNTSHRIVRHADIQRATGAIGENVNPIGHFEVDALPGQARQ